MKTRNIVIFVVLALLVQSKTLMAIGQDADSVKKATVFVRPYFSGKYISTNNPGEQSKMTSGFLVFEEGSHGRRYYLVTVNHLLLFFKEDESESGFICDDPAKDTYRIEVYADATGKKHLLTIDNNNIKKHLQKSKRESINEKADVAVIELTDIGTDEIFKKCIHCDVIASRNVLNKLNQNIQSGKTDIEYYSFMHNNQWLNEPKVKRTNLLSFLGETFKLHDQRDFLGFELNGEIIERGDCGGPIVYKYNSEIYVIGLINTNTMHPNLTQDSIVIRENIDQFKDR